MHMKIGLLVALCAVFEATCQMTEPEAAEYMTEINVNMGIACNQYAIADWDYNVDLENETAAAISTSATTEFLKLSAELAANISQIDYETFEDVALYRKYRFMADQGAGGLSAEDLEEYQTLQTRMSSTYSTATVCSYTDSTDCTLTLEPDVETIMATSTDYDELAYYFDQWREVTGRLMRDDYLAFAALSNQAAVQDGYADTGDYWLSPYTVTQKEADFYGTTENGLTVITADDFRVMVADAWQSVSDSLYKKLHAYVRMRLRETLYPTQIDPTGYLPAHVLGNMWAQDWTAIADYVKPFAEQPTFDVSDSMIENGWDITQMFEASEDFFYSIGLFQMTDDFKQKSVVDQEAHGKVMVCHASAWDFCEWPAGTDYRIKMCTEVNMADLITVHHEMGHIEYFMAYNEQEYVFRTGANPGFHEAIGDLIALSVSTPQHLEDILGLTPTPPVVRNSAKATNYTEAEQRDINFLMQMALQKIAFLPFGYLIDEYRWAIFDGTIDETNLNAEWWRLRQDLQGVTPPGGARGEEYFDAGAKYHVPANVPYIRYFFSFITQFQFHQNLCQIIGQDDPLYQCDIYDNTVAGGVLRSALEHGMADPWPLVMGELAGVYQVQADAIISYFQPLLDFFDEELVGECIGWGDDCL